MERWCNDNEGEIPKSPEKRLSHYHFLHNKTQID
jgi:hypothetical protein